MKRTHTISSDNFALINVNGSHPVTDYDFALRILLSLQASEHNKFHFSPPAHDGVGSCNKRTSEEKIVSLEIKKFLSVNLRLVICVLLSVSFRFSSRIRGEHAYIHAKTRR